MKKSNFFLFLAVLMLFFGTSCKKDKVVIKNEKDFEAFMEDEMDAQHIPAAAVLVFKENQILYENYFGYANLAQNLPLAENHLFLLASISKVVTATALLQLYDDGAFGLDDNINNYLPFNVSVPGYSRQITFRMLLTHTSAIADNDAVMDGQYYYNQDPSITLGYFLENYLTPGGTFYDENANFHDFEPGSQHEYSNMASALIGVLVERISGQDFNTYCKQNIFTPMGMSNTFWRLDEINQTIVTPYDYIGRENQAIDHYTNADYPNGGLRTNAGDLYLLASALANGGLSGSFRLLEQSTVQAMMTPQIPSIDNQVGLHFFLMDEANKLWGHDGGEQGVATIMGFNPDNKIGAIILSNQGEANLDEAFVNAYILGTQL